MGNDMRALQCAWDNQSAYDDADERQNEEIDELAQSMADNADERQRAVDWVGGEFSPSHYADVDLALFDLHGVHPSDLHKTNVLTRLYRLAETVHARYAEYFDERATAIIEAKRQQGIDDRWESRL